MGLRGTPPGGGGWGLAFPAGWRGKYACAKVQVTVYLHLDQDRKSKLDEVHSLIIRDVECKVLSKIPKIVMLHVHHYPH